MSDITTKKVFRFPVGALLVDARRFQTAFNDDQVGAPVAAHFAPTFPTDLDSQIDVVMQMMTRRNDAKSTAAGMTKSQSAAVRDYQEQASVLRTIAKVAFPDDPVRLHTAFGVGAQGNDLSSIMTGAELLLTSCATYADELSQHGWGPTATTELTAAVQALKDAHTTQHVASDGKERLTSQQAGEANRLYRQCRAIQAMARKVYPKSKLAKDSSIAGSRALFLIGEWPPRSDRPPADSGGASTGSSGGTPSVTSPVTATP